MFAADFEQLMKTKTPIAVQISGPTSISVGIGEGKDPKNPTITAYGLLEVKGESLTEGGGVLSCSKIRRKHL